MSNEEVVFEIKQGNLAKENMQILYDRNLPLIKKFINPYMAHVSEDEKQDLLQEAYFGLLEAVNKYESTENVSFITYSKWWIINAVRRYLNNNCSLIRIPEHIAMAVYHYNKNRGSFYKKTGRYPTLEEIAEILCVSVDEARKIEGYQINYFSLDSSFNEDDGANMSEFIKDEFDLERTVVDKMYKEHQKKVIWGVLERNLDTRETEVLVDQYKNGMTLQDIANKNNISISRVNQIKIKSLQKLRRGIARRELLNKMEIVESPIYRTGLNDFKRNDSMVERIAIKKLEIEEYWQHMSVGL